jgi:streptogramin lyase
VAALVLPASASAAGERLWFTESEAFKIGAITTSGNIVEYPLPSGSDPSGIASSGASLWFTQFGAAKVSRFNTFGSIAQEFTVGSGPSGIVFGVDGNLWFTELNTPAKIGRLTTSGALTEFPVPTSTGAPSNITSGPDGNLWFTEFDDNRIGRITTGGTITEFTVPTSSSQPSGITSGPDGAVWFTEENGNKIGRITTSGQFTEYTIPTPFSAPAEIVTGPDGALWFTKFGSNPPGIGRILPNGTFDPPNGYTLPAGSAPDGITVGPDGAIWFTENGGNKIGRITTSGAITEFPLPTGFRPGDIVVGPAEGGSGGGTPPPPGGGPGTGSSAAPSVQSLAVSPKSFRAAKAGASISAKVGAKVTYRLSVAARTRFTVERESVGRKKGKKCVKPTRRNRRAKKCKLYKAVRGSFTHNGSAGTNVFKFTGRINRKSLKPGKYRLVAVATSGSTKSALKAASFKIVRR